MDVPLNVAHSVLSSDEPHMSGEGNRAALYSTVDTGSRTWKNLRGAPLAVTFRTSGVSALQASWPSCPKSLYMRPRTNSTPVTLPCMCRWWKRHPDPGASEGKKIRKRHRANTWNLLGSFSRRE